MENQWRQSLHQMIEWIDYHLDDDLTLNKLASEMNYSIYYCSTLFHRIIGMTFKKYLLERKLTHVAIALRDSQDRILDIAIRYGYSSQEALTRAFVKRFGYSPNEYRKSPKPMVFSTKPEILFLEHCDKGGSMSELKEAKVRIEHLPAHKYVGIWESRASNYGEFFTYHDCDEITGIVESMRHVALGTVGAHMAGWFNKGYFYGFGVPLDYDGPIPEGFEVKEFPASDYLVFYHPAYDYPLDNGTVMNRVEKLAWDYDFKENEFWWISKNYEWNETCQSYQRHFPEALGYEVLRPIK